jgi:hypothetical protein
MSDLPILENSAQTMRDAMQELGAHAEISAPTAFKATDTHLVSVPTNRNIEDLSPHYRKAAEYLKPLRRQGTARLEDLQSLIDWTNRFKGVSSALFAQPDMEQPSLISIADYHAEGPKDDTTPTGDATARHCNHRATYNFPLSNEWKDWMKISGELLDKDDMGEFIEAQAKDILAPTPNILSNKEADNNEPWENRLIRTAQQIEGRYGQLTQLLAMSKQFQVFETSDIKVSTNRDTGESEIQFLDEHKGPDGRPLNIPNLIIIAIPVFVGGAPYRMAVRFRYRKLGGMIKFILKIYNPEKVFEAAFDEAIQRAKDQTALPLFKGKPEA